MKINDKSLNTNAVFSNPKSMLIQSAIENLPTVGILILTIYVGLSLNILNQNVKSQKKFIYRILWVGSFLTNLVTVQLPGRFDSLVTVKGKDKFPWRNLFAPSAWAFSIWGVIYLSELLLTLFVGVAGDLVPCLPYVTPYWMAGNLFQSLWCGCFRPKFINKLWLPATELGLAAIAFSFAHLEVTKAILSETDIWKIVGLILIRTPLSLHTGWLSAATLLNLNSWFAVSKVSLTNQLSIATASSYGAVLLGSYLVISRRDPFIGLTFAWALAALADKTKKEPEVEIALIANESLSSTQKFFSQTLAIISAIAPFTDTLLLAWSGFRNSNNIF
jgi:hypothetical protein